MLKFRALKDKIVCSKRHSQKLSEEQLLSLADHEQHSLSRLNLSLSSKLHAQIHQITHENYKIAHRRGGSEGERGDRGERVRTECVQASETMSRCLDLQQTAKKGGRLTRSAVEGSNFNRIVELLREVIELKKLRAECPRQSSQLGTEMREKLASVRVLLRSLEDDSQKSLIDFYNEECEDEHSPHSFHSQSSDETYQPQTDREAYELSERKDTHSTEDHDDPVEIRYRRLSPSRYREDSIFEMLGEEEGEGEGEGGASPECATSEQRAGAIVHLFSYEKENGLDSPLSRITEREEEYFSPESKQSSLAASLEYKKIFYLLETSGKKEEQTYRREGSEFRAEVSEFSANERTPTGHSVSHNESKDRSRCHQQLGEMISLLENKYHRKVKIGVENLMDSLNLAIKDKSIKLRRK